ncbi:hypothetical protein ACWGRT_24805 [Streptomyces albidoflavus]
MPGSDDDGAVQQPACVARRAPLPGWPVLRGQEHRDGRRRVRYVAGRGQADEPRESAGVLRDQDVPRPGHRPQGRLAEGALHETLLDALPLGEGVVAVGLQGAGPGEEWPAWEQLDHVAGSAFQDVTGRTDDDFHEALDALRVEDLEPGEPVGEQWDARGDEGAARRLPHLAKAFPPGEGV